MNVLSDNILRYSLPLDLTGDSLKHSPIPPQPPSVAAQRFSGWKTGTSKKLLDTVLR